MNKLKIVVPTVVVVMIVTSVGALGYFDFLYPKVCGDNVCNLGESVETCPIDCKGFCGDNVCHPDTETEFNCPADCAEPALCGDGVCESDENVNNCPADCVGICGDGICHPTESLQSCPGDCQGTCGDAYCNPTTESVQTCPADCVGTCGDGVCHSTEDVNSCPNDCHGTCGDSYCHTTEGASCAEDCLPDCGNGICEQASCQALGCPIDENINNCPEDCTPEEPPGGLAGVCSNEELEIYIETSSKTDEELVNDFEDYCYGLGTDSHGCPIEEEVSLFDISTKYNLAVAECNSVCAWDGGKPDYGYREFVAVWHLGPPRDCTDAEAGILTLQESCGGGLSWLPWINPLQVVYF